MNSLTPTLRHAVLRPARWTSRAAVRCVARSSSFEQAVDVSALRTTDVTPGHIVVLGGNGFVGSAVCRAAVARGLAVTSLSRSGAPLNGRVPGVNYEVGDVFRESSYAESLSGAQAVVSCIGGFGSNEAMKRINGDATVAAVATAKAAGVPRFVFVSVHEYNLPSFVTDSIGYFTGKRAAEAAVLSAYGEAGACLQPGFIYGDRVVGASTIPLGTVGKPLEAALAGPLGTLLKPLAAVPFSDVLLAPPVSVDAVAAAAIRCATGAAPRGGRFNIDDINTLAADAWTTTA